MENTTPQTLTITASAQRGAKSNGRSVFRSVAALSVAALALTGTAGAATATELGSDISGPADREDRDDRTDREDRGDRSDRSDRDRTSDREDREDRDRSGRDDEDEDDFQERTGYIEDDDDLDDDLDDRDDDERDEDDDEADGDQGRDSEAGPAYPLYGDELSDIALTGSELPTGWEVEDDPEVIFETGDGGTFYKDFFINGMSLEQECADAVDALDSIEEDAEAMAIGTYEIDGETVEFVWVSTVEEHDFFDGYYEDIIEECGTLSEPEGEIELREMGLGLEGLHAELDFIDGTGGDFFMGGESYGHNHIMFVGGGEDLHPYDVEDLAEAQLEKFEDMDH